MKHITEPLLAMLRAGPRSALELAQSLSSSGPTILRALRALERDQRVLRMGKTKGARYALRRTVGAIGSRWPLFRVDARGAVQELGMLEALERDSYRVSAGPARMQQLFEGIPYFLQDGRPAGFLGRSVPGLFPELNLPDRVVDWTDEHVFVYLTQRAPDMPGALIVGAESMDRYLAGLQAAPVVLRNARTREYPRYARLSMEGTPPGSFAQGEQPKFTARVDHNSQRVAVIVKFSPPLSTVTGRRWGDLLRAEHLAHLILSEHGIAACRSELLQYDERVFLECERFDRVGGEGRRSTVSLFALDISRYGHLDSWTAAAERLAPIGCLPRRTRIRSDFLMRLARSLPTQIDTLATSPCLMSLTDRSRLLRYTTCCLCCLRPRTSRSCRECSSHRHPDRAGCPSGHGPAPWPKPIGSASPTSPH